VLGCTGEGSAQVTKLWSTTRWVP